jgi:hypothetical protein
MKLKIKRHTYTITEKDLFMDNGACIQLLTQSKEKSNWGSKPTPVLSKKAIKEINKFERLQKKHGYNKSIQVFSLNLGE